MNTIKVSASKFSKFKTIGEAIKYAESGNTIVIEAGTYKEILHINMWKIKVL